MIQSWHTCWSQSKLCKQSDCFWALVDSARLEEKRVGKLPKWAYGFLRFWMKEEGQLELWLIMTNEPIMHLKLLKVLSDFLIQRAIFFLMKNLRENTVTENGDQASVSVRVYRHREPELRCLLVNGIWRVLSSICFLLFISVCVVLWVGLERLYLTCNNTIFFI